MPKAIIAVDLDGTLMRGDSFLMACRAAAGKNIFSFINKCFSGLSKLKWEIYRQLDLPEIGRIQWNEPLIAWLSGQKLEGAEIYLVSAAPEYFLEEIKNRLGQGTLFAGIIGSTAEENRRGKAKASALVFRFKEKGFDYVGNSQADIPVWKAARTAYNVNPSRGLISSAKAAGIALIQIADNPQDPLMEFWDGFKRATAFKFNRRKS